MKKSFNELMAAEQAAKHNSDLQNLVTAKIAIINNRKQLDAFFNAYYNELNDTELKLDAIIAEIEAGNTQDVRDVKVIYDLAKRPKTKFDDFEIIL